MGGPNRLVGGPWPPPPAPMVATLALATCESISRRCLLVLHTPPWGWGQVPSRCVHMHAMWLSEYCTLSARRPKDVYCNNSSIQSWIHDFSESQVNFSCITFTYYKTRVCYLFHVCTCLTQITKRNTTRFV